MMGKEWHKKPEVMIVLLEHGSAQPFSKHTVEIELKPCETYWELSLDECTIASG